MIWRHLRTVAVSLDAWFPPSRSLWPDTSDKRAFASELSMSLDQLREMSRAGMGIACDGYDHPWLKTLSDPQQAEQVRKGLDFLNFVIDTKATRVLACPCGSHSPNLLALARLDGCIAGFTTDVANATNRHDPLLLPRVDTNDLPTRGDAQLAEWTIRAISHVR